MRWLSTALLTLCCACNASLADTAELILPGDPRFNVFELTNSAGDGTFPSPGATVVLSFLSEDQRYCRMARFAAEATFVLACRNERGWQIEATSSVSRSEANYPTTLGGGPMPEIAAALEVMHTRRYPLDHREIIDAANNDWQAPAPVDYQALHPVTILQRAGRAYRTSKSYIDTGTVETVYTTDGRQRIGETTFKTAYVAPSDFRFESKMGDFGNFDVRYIVWSDKNGARKWSSLGADIIEGLESVQSGLDEAAGVTRDTSGMIPGLIFRGTKLGGDIVRLREPVRLGDTTIDGFDCFLVEGTRWPHKGPTRVWIDKESYLIRRVYEEDVIKNGTTKTTWYYDPAIDVPVDAGTLEFAKPESQ